MAEIQQGDICRVLHDIKIGEQTAFFEGEYLPVEAITPNPQRPEYRYVCDSKTLGRKFQLSDADVAFVERETRPQQPPLQAAPIQPQQGPAPGKDGYAEQPETARTYGVSEWGKARPAESYVKKAPSKTGFALLWEERRPYIIVGALILLVIIGFVGFKLLNRPSGPQATMDKFFKLGEAAKVSDMLALWDPQTLKDSGDLVKGKLETQFSATDNTGKYYGVLPAGSMRYETTIKGDKASLHITSEYLNGSSINAVLVKENGGWYIQQYSYGGAAIPI